MFTLQKIWTAFLQKMAVHLRTASLFKTSRILFRKDDGTPYRFYYEHASDDLRCIINKGHGYLVNDPAEAEILLCEKKTDNRITQGYLPVDFIVDCVKRNTFLNMNTYRDDVLGLKASASKHESLNSRMPGKDDSAEEANMMKFSEPFRIQVKENGLMGRKKYSDLDDFKIIKYLIHHKKYTETGGNLVWKQMELLKVTDHSHQSMKDRFRKKIRPEIDTYEIPETWKSKLRGDYIDDHSSDEELDEDTTFNYIDEWNDEFKKCSNKKKLMQSAEVQKRTSPNGSSTRTVVNDPPSDASGVPSAASLMKNSSAAWLGRKKVANLKDSDFEALTISNSDNLLRVQRQSGDESDHHSGNLMESVLCQHEASADKQQGTQSVDYIYDDMDCLILSEANKCQNADGADTVSNHADSSRTRVTAISQPEATNNFSCVEMPPIHSRKVSQHLYNNTEKRDTGKDKVILNIYSGSVKTTSLESEGRDLKNCNSSNQQKEISDEVVEVSEPMNSVNTIRNIFKKGSAKPRKETHSLLSKNHNSEVKDVESDTYYSAKDQKVDENNVKESVEMSPRAVNKKMASRKGSVSKSHSNSSDSVEEPSLHLKAGPSGVHSLSKRSEKERINKNNVTKPVENSSKKVHKKLSPRKASVKPHSDSVESIDGTSNRHPNSPSKTASSTRNKRVLGSDDNYDGSTSVNSPYKKKRVQQSPLGRPAAESTRLSIESLQSPPRQGKSLNWLSKEKTWLNIEYLSKMYELEVCEAALLLKLHKGCFLSAIKELESRPCDEATNARTTDKT